MTASTTSLLTAEALAAVERALGAFGVVPVRHSLGSSLYRLEFDLDGDTVAIVGWGNGLHFVDDELPPELIALIHAFAHLAPVGGE
jgi:hypothetical protein